jgi:NADH-quinone oxidoreductase subunit G
MTDKITIEIDDRACEAAPGEMIITVADRMGIQIPRFCYHKKLSIAANCRMCLVEAEQGGRPFPKPVPACATPVAQGMKVWTRSPKAIDAQQGTMEFLLINHPLDCPICDQGGECELQDVAVGYGGDVSRFTEGKRVVKDEDFGPLISPDMTRCIQCTRCVRFCAEIAGVREIGATGRGEEMRIGTFIAHAISHELSSNIIDLCPVGALTAKPSRFTARAWELTGVDSIAPHDGIGSNLRLHIRNGQVIRVHPRENDAVNETWISDRDRYSYTGINSSDRLTAPMLKQNGVWREVDWSTALTRVAEQLKSAPAAATGWLLSPTATLEELYLAQRLARELGCANIDHRLRQQDFSGDRSDPLLPWLGVTIPELEAQRGFLLIGTDLRQEQPLLAHRVRKAALAGAQVVCINPLRLDLNHHAQQFVSAPALMLADLVAIAQSAGVSKSGAWSELFAAVTPTAAHVAAAACLHDAGQQDSGLIVLGALATAHPNFALLKALASAIAEATHCRIGYLPAAANSVGAYLAGAHPQRLPGARPTTTAGLATADLLKQLLNTLVLWGIEPELDVDHPANTLAACARAECVIACSAFRSTALDAAADILLPIGIFAETSGTYVNASGTWQRFQGAIAPPGEARPGWKVLRVLGNLLDIKGFDYQDGAQISGELATLCADSRFDNTPSADLAPQGELMQADMMRIGGVPIYATDLLVRRALPLQQLSTPRSNFGVYLHPNQADALGLSAEDWVQVSQAAGTVTAPLFLDDRIAIGCAYISAGIAASAVLGNQIGVIDLIQVAAPISTGIQ